MQRVWVVVFPFDALRLIARLWKRFARGQTAGVGAERSLERTSQLAPEKLGNPTTQFNGHYGIPGAPWESGHPNCITRVYKKPGGTLYVTIEPKNGEWIRFGSQWLPDGAVF